MLPSIVFDSALGSALSDHVCPSLMEPLEKKKKKKKTKEEKEATVKNEGEESMGTELPGLLESKPLDEGLLRAIVSFLERHGFSKTLSALQSEAQGVFCSAFCTDGQFSGLKDKDSIGGIQINGDKSEVIVSKEVNNRKRSNGIEIDVLNFCDLEVDHSNTVVLDDSSVMRPAVKEKKKKKRRKISDDCNAEHTKQAENEMSYKFGNLGDELENVKSVCTGLDGKSEDAIVLLTEPKRGKKKKRKSYTCQEEDVSLNHGNTSKVANVNALQGASYTVSLNDTCLSSKSKSTSDGLCCEAVSSSNGREVHGNDNIEDKELGGHTVETHKKGSKGSTEPKTVNAFQRVNPDEATFADERLQNNSYWAKGGDESGYGARAQEVLGQVRGNALSTDGQFSDLKEKDSLGGLQINGGKSEVIASEEVNNRKRSSGIEIDMLNFFGPEDDLNELHPASKKKKKKCSKTSDNSNVEDTKQSENEKSRKFGNLGDALENVKSVCVGLDGKSKDAIVPLALPKHGKKEKKKTYTSQEEDASQNQGKASQEEYAEKFNEFLSSEVENVNTLKGSSYTISLNERCLSYKNKKKKSKSTSDGIRIGNVKTEDRLLLEGVESTNDDDAKIVCDKTAKQDTDVQPHHSLATSKEKKRKRKSTTKNLQVNESKDVCCVISSEDASGGGKSMVKEETCYLKSKDAEFAQVKKEKMFKDLVKQLSVQSEQFVMTSMLKPGLKSNMEGNPEAVSSLSVSEVHANGNIEDNELGGCTAETHKKGSVLVNEPVQPYVQLSVQSKQFVMTSMLKPGLKSNMKGNPKTVSSLNVSEDHANGNIEDNKLGGYTAETHKKGSVLVNEAVQPYVQLSVQSKQFVMTSMLEPGLKSNMEGNPEAVSSSNISEVPANGNTEDNELGGYTAETHKKGSAERVSPDEVTFADERLQNTSYWAKMSGWWRIWLWGKRP